MHYFRIVFVFLYCTTGFGQTPVITGQNELRSPQGASYTIRLTDLTVVDSNGNPYPNYPAGFKLDVFNGANYRVSNNTITPDPNFTGTLTVPVRVNDGKRNSSKFDLKIVVFTSSGGGSDDDDEKENTPPVITGQKNLTTDENTPITINFSDLTVSDPDDEYPTGFTLRLGSGSNYTINGNTVTPAAGFSGTLTVPVDVNDGTDWSSVFQLKVSVVPAATNVPPVIIAQSALTVEEGSSITIRLSNIVVNDPDNTYPDGFTLKISGGDNYTVSGTTITPVAGFTGVLTVPIRVNDGKDDSPVFALQITVTPKAQNAPPVIVGQTTLSTLKNQPIAIGFANLIVTDPDNEYPKDFTMAIQGGANYTVSGNQVTPSPDFVGVLTINVTVNDGTSTSNVFSFRLEVINTGDLQIISQALLEMEEDTKLVLRLADLVVNDPDNRYPQGFTLRIAEGNNYSVDGLTIVPAPDFFGTLEIPVRVSDGSRDSNPFVLIVLVTPVNDPPVLEGLSETPLQYATGIGALPIARQLNIIDVDDEELSFAEISFRPGSYQQGGDELIPNYGSTILRSVFDPSSGILFIIGQAPLIEYEQMIRSIGYRFNFSDTLQPDGAKIIEIAVSDGKDRSEIKQVEIEFSEISGLDIPTVFTPNDDNSNDTWKIRGSDGSDMNGELVIRVYNKRGYLVYEAYSLAEWDGKHNGKPLPPDTYFYTIEVTAPFARRSYKGVVTILH